MSLFLYLRAKAIVTATMCAISLFSAELFAHTLYKHRDRHGDEYAAEQYKRELYHRYGFIVLRGDTENRLTALSARIERESMLPRVL